MNVVCHIDFMKVNFLQDFQPALFQSLKTYNKEKFFADLMSGLIVGVVALPLAIAFGIASGVTPEKGIYTAIIAGFIISFLGGSKVQIGGPTGAFIVIVYGIVEQSCFEIPCIFVLPDVIVKVDAHIVCPFGDEVFIAKDIMIVVDKLQV